MLANLEDMLVGIPSADPDHDAIVAS
jgi:hypothetical protein